MTKKEEAIKRIMDGLKCSAEEAEEIYVADNAIDHGEATDFDLTTEQQAIAKKYTTSGTRKAPTVYKFDTKNKPKPKRKGDDIKIELIKFLDECIEDCELVTTHEVTNETREIRFRTSEYGFKLTLTKDTKGV